MAQERADEDEAERGTVVTPSAEFPPLAPDERAALRRIGDRWRSPDRPDELPVDPTLGRDGRRPAPSRFGRLAPIEMFTVERAGRTGRHRAGAVCPAPGWGAALTRLRQALFGPPLRSSAVLYERMRKLVALPILSSDLLSSVAYGPEAMLTVLVLAGSGALGLSLPLAAALVVLMIAVGVSYRQTIPRLPARRRLLHRRR